GARQDGRPVPRRQPRIKRCPVVAPHQAQGRLGRRRGHHRIRAAEREEQRRLRRDPRRRESRDLDVEPSRTGWRDRRDVPEDRRTGAGDEVDDGDEGYEGPEGACGAQDGGEASGGREIGTDIENFREEKRAEGTFEINARREAPHTSNGQLVTGNGQLATGN